MSTREQLEAVAEHPSLVWSRDLEEVENDQLMVAYKTNPSMFSITDVNNSYSSSLFTSWYKDNYFNYLAGKSHELLEWELTLPDELLEFVLYSKVKPSPLKPWVQNEETFDKLKDSLKQNGWWKEDSLKNEILAPYMDEEENFKPGEPLWETIQVKENKSEIYRKIDRLGSIITVLVLIIISLVVILIMLLTTVGW